MINRFAASCIFEPQLGHIEVVRSSFSSLCALNHQRQVWDWFALPGSCSFLLEISFNALSADKYQSGCSRVSTLSWLHPTWVVLVDRWLKACNMSKFLCFASHVCFTCSKVWFCDKQALPTCHHRLDTLNQEPINGQSFHAVSTKHWTDATWKELHAAWVPDRKRISPNKRTTYHWRRTTSNNLSCRTYISLMRWSWDRRPSYAL